MSTTTSRRPTPSHTDLDNIVNVDVKAGKTAEVTLTVKQAPAARADIPPPVPPVAGDGGQDPRPDLRPARRS